MKTRMLKSMDSVFGRLFCAIFALLDDLLKGAASRTEETDPLRKILFIRPGGMGDFLCLLPAIHGVKKALPQSSIHVLAEKRNRAVALLTPAIDRVLCYDLHPAATLRALWDEEYDAVVDTEQFHHFSSVFSYITRAKMRIGLRTNPHRLSLYTHLIDYSNTGWEAMEFYRLTRRLGVQGDPTWPIPGIRGEKILATPLPASVSRLAESRPSLIVIGAGGGDPYRRWTTTGYREVLAHLLRDSRRGVIFVGGKGEENISRMIMEDLGQREDRIVSMVGKTNFLELCRILLEGEVFIGPDSGVSILASALGVKGVALFGSTDYRKWAGPSRNQRVVRKNLPCSPCYLLGKYKGCRSSMECMSGICSQEVISALADLGI